MNNGRISKLLNNSIKYIFLQVLCQWISLGCKIVIVYHIAKISEDTLAYSVSKDEVKSRVMCMLLAMAVNFVSDKLYYKASYNISIEVKEKLQNAIYKKMLNLGNDYKKYISSDEVIHLTTEGVEDVEKYYMNYLPRFFVSLITPITIFIVFCFIDFLSAGALFIVTPFLLGIVILITNLSRNGLLRIDSSKKKISDEYRNGLDGITTFKIYDADAQIAEKLKNESNGLWKSFNKHLLGFFSSAILADIITYGGTILGIIIALSRYGEGKLNISGVVMIILLSMEMFIPIRKLLSISEQKVKGINSSDRISEILGIGEEKEEISEYDDDPIEDEEEEEIHHEVTEDRTIKYQKIDIKLEDVSYECQENRHSLRNINAAFEYGKLNGVAVLSEQNGGVIADLLSGNIRDYSGSIKLNDDEAEGIGDRKSLVSILSKDCYLFTGTVRDNLKMADPEAEDSKLLHILDALKLKGYFESKRGLDTVVCADDNLTKGQRLRICFARAILADSQIYIIDDVTEGLDKESEKIVLHNIRSLADKKTVVCISHRLSSITGADNIYVLKDGTIIGCDNHIGLLEKCEEYRDEFQKQQKYENYVKTKGVRVKKYIKNDALNIQNNSNDKVDITEPSDVEFFDEDIITRRPSLLIFGRLIRLMKSLMPLTFISMLIGSMSYICTMALTAIAGADIVGGYYSKEFYLILAGIVAVAILFRFGYHYTSSILSVKTSGILGEKIFDKMRTIAPSKTNERGIEKRNAYLIKDIDKLECFYGQVITTILIALIVSTSMVIFMFGRSRFAALVGLLGFYLVGAVIPLVIEKLGEKRRYDISVKNTELKDFISEAVLGLNDIVRFGYGDKELELLKAKTEKLHNAYKTYVGLEGNKRAIINLVINLTEMAVMTIAAWQVNYGAILGLDYILLVMIIMCSFEPFMNLSDLSGNIMHVLISGERTLRVFDEECIIKESTDVSSENQEELLQNQTTDNTEIILDNVSFSYGQAFVLKDINVRFPENKISAICGPDKSGKTTLLKLMMRYWDPQFVTLEIGRDDIKNIPMAKLRSLESFVMKKTWLMDDTIRNNIRIGRMDASDEDIESAAQKAGLHDYIMSQENGYDTHVGRYGTALSEGREQLLGIARAILHDSPIIYMDEPTGNMDAMEEGAVFETIEALNDKTIILTSHRETTINIADVVYEIQG